MNKLRADIFKKWCQTIPRPSVFIFDLDLTIWDCTIEEDDFVNNNNIQNYVPPERHYMLTQLQDLGHELNIGSRSSEPVECQKHLKKSALALSKKLDIFLLISHRSLIKIIHLESKIQK